MPSSASSPRPYVAPADSAPSGRAPACEPLPVPPDWLTADPADNKRRVLAMLEQSERDIAAGDVYDLDEVLAELDAK